MRKIYYRAWDKVTKSFYIALTEIYFDGGIYAVGFMSSLGDTKIVYLNQNEIEIDQFVEEKDDEKYFENDIVEVLSHYEGDVYKKLVMGIITWNDYGFDIMDLKTGEYICSFWNFINNWNGGVVGNKWQNPELIKGIKAIKEDI